MVYVGSRNVKNHRCDATILMLVSTAAAHCTGRLESQHDIAQDDSKAQERTTNDLTHRAAGVVVGAGISGFGSTTGPRGDSRVGRAGGREGGSNNRRGGGERNGGSSFFNLEVNTSNERSQLGALHVFGEVEQLNPRDRAREVLRRGEVRTLGINNNGVPVWSRSSGRSGSSIFSDRDSAFEVELVVNNRSTVDKPVTVLPLALVGADGAGVNHCDRIVPIKGDGRVGGSEREVRGVRDLIF